MAKMVRRFIRTGGFRECHECFGVGGHWSDCDKTR